MSVVEDSRKILQDFLAPELRGIAARMEELEKRYESLDHKVEQVDQRLGAKIDQLDQRLNVKIDQSEQRLNAKIDQVDQRSQNNFNALSLRMDEADRKADRRHDEIMTALRSAAETTDIKVRLARLEEKQSRRERTRQPEPQHELPAAS